MCLFTRCPAQVYHYLAGVRHMYWDHARYGNMADKHSPLEVSAATGVAAPAPAPLLLAAAAVPSRVLCCHSLLPGSLAPLSPLAPDPRRRGLLEARLWSIGGRHRRRRALLHLSSSCLSSGC